MSGFHRSSYTPYAAKHSGENKTFEGKNCYKKNNFRWKKFCKVAISDIT